MNHPYLPNTTADREAMLAAIGVKSFDELVDYIPSQHLKPPLNIPSAMSEMDLTRQLKQMSGRNATTNTHACFLGAGAANHYIPPVIGSLISRGEFLTSYTPYQPEVAQGTLQAGFEFQTMLCDLFNMEVANLGMYDGVTAFAEAALMACRLTKRKKVAVLNTVDKRMLEVTSAYTKWQDVEIVVVSPTDPKLDSDTAALAIQSPTSLEALKTFKTCRVRYTTPADCRSFIPTPWRSASSSPRANSVPTSSLPKDNRWAYPYPTAERTLDSLCAARPTSAKCPAGSPASHATATAKPAMF